MADNTPHDPFDERLRATFAAEHADIERRHLARSTPVNSGGRRSIKTWAPLAIAATVLAIAGFAFLGNRGDDDRAVELDIANQPGDNNGENGDGDGGGEDGNDDQGSNSPAGTPVPTPPAECVRVLTGQGPHFVMNPNPGEPIMSYQTAAIDAPVARVLADNTAVHLAGNCTTTEGADVATQIRVNARGPDGMEWIDPAVLVETVPACLVERSAGTVSRSSGPAGETVSGQTNGWSYALGDVVAFSVDAFDPAYFWYPASAIDLGRNCTPGDAPLPSVVALPPNPPGSTGPPVEGAAPNECGRTIQTWTPYFVWHITIDDVDGGLIAHTAPGVDEPVTRVLPYNAVVSPTGGCSIASNGSAWYELIGESGFEWVSGRFIRQAEASCIYGIWLPSPEEGVRVTPPAADGSVSGPVAGWGIPDGDGVAFWTDGWPSYNVFPIQSTTVGRTCLTDGPDGPVCLSGIDGGPVRVYGEISAVPVQESATPIEAIGLGTPIRGIGPLGPGVQVFEVTTGLVDPTTVEISVGPCPVGGGGDSDRPSRFCEAPRGPVFVTGIDENDPDGGLVAHTAPDVVTPVTRILDMNAVVSATSRCVRADNGTPWFELYGDAGNDWVSSNFITTAVAGCLRGDWNGARLEDGAADFTASGPIDGWAIVRGSQVAFAPGFDGPTEYRWYPRDAVELGSPCLVPSNSGPACLTGEVRILDLGGSTGHVSRTGPFEVRLTGMKYVPSVVGAGEYLQLTYLELDAITIGFVDTSLTLVSDGPCPEPDAVTGPDDLASLDCTDDAPNGSNPVVWGGRESSDATQVLGMRSESDQTCSRLVITFGTDTLQPAAVAPPLTVGRLSLTETTVRLTDRPLLAKAEVPKQVNFGRGTALIAADRGGTLYVQLLHKDATATVRVLQDPARLVIDLIPSAGTNENRYGPLGQEFILPGLIQTDWYGPGLPTTERIEVWGFARPFEASGELRIYQVEADFTLANSNELPPSLFVDLLPTSAWIDAWGTFSVTLPDLMPGTYLVLFGEVPPIEGQGFRGSGQIIRIYDPDEPQADVYPWATPVVHIELPPG